MLTDVLEKVIILLFALLLICLPVTIALEVLA